MAAYVISHLTPRDPEAFANYRNNAEESIRQYGGRYLVRGARPELLEGEGELQTLVVVEFPTSDQARIWYRSAEYAKALEYRDKALSRTLILAEGVPGNP
jgi:uncharacterized protein (DUF1330 family)